MEEETHEPVDTLQARAKALRRRANPKPGQSRASSSIVGASSEVVASTEKADSTSSQTIVVRDESPIAEVNLESSSSAGVPRSVGCGVVEIPINPEVEAEIGPGCVLIGEASAT